MRKSVREHVNQWGNDPVMDGDGHDMLTKSIFMEDVQPVAETGMGQREIQAEKSRLDRG